MLFWDENSCFICVLTAGVFDVLAYTDTDVAVPFTWIESDPKLIANPQMVKLHSFDTKVWFVCCLSLIWNFGNPNSSFVFSMQIHKVDTLVSYKNDDEWDES